MEYHDIDTSIQGASVSKTIDVGAFAVAKIKEKDIILGIRSDGNYYNVDNFGLISVPWCDKRIPLSNQELILSLTPNDIDISVYKWRQKKIIDKSVLPTPIPFKVTTMYHNWEPVHYSILGGCVFQELTMIYLPSPVYRHKNSLNRMIEL